MPAEGHQPMDGKEKVPCRTCTDFKSWSKMQRKTLSTTSAKPPNSEVSPNTASSTGGHVPEPSALPKHCPLDKERLGRHTWGLLHTMAAYYPDDPSPQDRTNVQKFFDAFAKVYPCEYCAKDFQKELKDSPPETKSQHTLSQWLCRMHNRVNVKIGKPEFDCSKVNERWRDGPADGSCD